jgi:hypothetical protein
MTTCPTTMRDSGFVRNELAENGTGCCLQTPEAALGTESDPEPVALVPAVLT